MVRRNTLLIFTQLLVQDYVKFRGFLLYRFLACIADPNENVAAFAKQVLMGPLLRRWPNLFVQHIVEAVVVLNGFSEHPVYTAVGANGAESITEDSMDGVHLTAQDRIVVYEAMLEQLSDEQRIQVWCHYIYVCVCVCTLLPLHYLGLLIYFCSRWQESLHRISWELPLMEPYQLFALQIR